jgi:hypothetical protein
MPNEPADKDAAREAIHYALNSDYCVLEFEETDDGMRIVDITDHVEALEEKINNATDV